MYVKGNTFLYRKKIYFYYSVSFLKTFMLHFVTAHFGYYIVISTSS